MSIVPSEVRRARDEIARLELATDDWIALATRASELVRRRVPFQRVCWHTVDPGTVLLTGSLNQNIACSGRWLAEHEYIIEDVNKWAFLAASGTYCSATSIATYGDLRRSARHRSQAGYGIGDELRASLVIDGTCWAAVGFLRDEGEPWFNREEVECLASMREPLAALFRRAVLATLARTQGHAAGADAAPGVVVFDSDGEPESISPAAEEWIGQLIEIPRPACAADSKIVRALEARARALDPDRDPLQLAARCRVQTRSGRWLLLYGTRLAGSSGNRTAVILQPAAGSEVASLVALAYALTERESQVVRLCMKGESTKAIARSLGVSPYTVQDHLKSIFGKTGVRSRGELIGRVFLEHYVPRWEDLPHARSGWLAKGSVVTEPGLPPGAATADTAEATGRPSPT